VQLIEELNYESMRTRRTEKTRESGSTPASRPA